MTGQSAGGERTVLRRATALPGFKHLKWLLPLVTLVIVRLISGCAQTETGPQKPNLIIVLVDTLRSDHLHYHGYHRDTSPRIDALARDSQVFLNHYSTASRTGPAVASLFTGLHVRSHGVINPLTHFDAKGVLAEKQTTLAEILSSNGYDCFGFVSNYNASARFGFAQGFETYEYVRSTKAADLNREAFDLLGTEIRQPFFLYLHYMDPHSPYFAPGEYRSLYVDPEYRGPITGSHGQLDEIVAGRLEVDSSDVAHMEAIYDQEIRYFDDEFGRLLGFLDDQDLRENTILVFVADHGEEFLDHGSVLHGYTLYEEQLRVPFFVHDPRRRQPREIEAITRHVDVLPTLLDLLAIEYDGAHQGRSLISLLDGDPGDEAEAEVFAEASLMAVKTIRMRSLLSDGWKLIETLIPVQRVELYNIGEDGTELRDLAGEEPQVVAELRERMEELIRSYPAAGPEVVRLSEEEIEKLRALGYVK
jgi:arylsulfatase A-like enzyme